MKTEQFRAVRLLMLLFFCLCLSGFIQAGNLPNYVIPLKDNTNKQKTMLVFITGDGGYNDFSKSLLAYFTQEGYPRLVIDAKKYFWKRKDPQEAGRDFERYIDHFKRNGIAIRSTLSVIHFQRVCYLLSSVTFQIL
ncbi:virulence factor [Sphingobacterium sp. E70]|uniref:virulence factor n=1 Tax=Sphingobacterium sp. E70 TaxID=2853439 RepID=UPI00211C347E|nr:virulence factor [Sphingobacterium sp. E70]